MKTTDLEINSFMLAVDARVQQRCTKANLHDMLYNAVCRDRVREILNVGFLCHQRHSGSFHAFTAHRHTDTQTTHNPFAMPVVSHTKHNASLWSPTVKSHMHRTSSFKTMPGHSQHVHCSPRYEDDTFLLAARQRQ